MINRFSSALALVALIGSFVAVPATRAFAQGGNNQIPIGLTCRSRASCRTSARSPAHFSISSFAIQDGALVANGQLNGTVTDTAAGAVRTIVTSIAWPVANAGSAAAADAAASCDTAAETARRATS